MCPVAKTAIWPGPWPDVSHCNRSDTLSKHSGSLATRKLTPSCCVRGRARAAIGSPCPPHSPHGRPGRRRAAPPPGPRTASARPGLPGRAGRRARPMNLSGLHRVLLQREQASVRFCHRIAVCYAPGGPEWQIGGQRQQRGNSKHSGIRSITKRRRQGCNSPNFTPRPKAGTGKDARRHRVT